MNRLGLLLLVVAGLTACATESSAGGVVIPRPSVVESETTATTVPVTTTTEVEGISYEALNRSLNDPASSETLCTELYGTAEDDYASAVADGMRAFEDSGLSFASTELLRVYINECFWTGRYSGWPTSYQPEPLVPADFSYLYDIMADRDVTLAACEAAYALPPSQYDNGYDLTLFTFTDLWGEGSLSDDAVLLIRDFFDQCYTTGEYEEWYS